MINRGKKNVYFEIFTVAFMWTAAIYFTLGLAWQMAKGWF